MNRVNLASLKVHFKRTHLPQAWLPYPSTGGPRSRCSQLPTDVMPALLPSILPASLFPFQNLTMSLVTNFLSDAVNFSQNAAG